MSTVQSCLRTALALVFAIVVVAFVPAAADAGIKEDTTWICKPGQALSLIHI